jgi:transposase
MTIISNVFGVDVSKDELVVGCQGEDAVHPIANSTAAISAWLKRLPAGSVVAMESTGRYHQLLAALAHDAGMHVYVLNAQSVYFYAKGLGIRGKTDRVDCGVITRYVAEHRSRLHEWTPVPPHLSNAERLIRHRALVVSKRDALRLSMREVDELADSFRELDRALNSFVDAIDKKIESLIKADTELHAAQRRIATVAGFGPLGSSILAVLLARVPFANSDALVAYSGMDLRASDSGRKRGRRAMTKHGAPYLRRQWYMAGMAATHNKALRPAYDALRAKGFQSTEAILILGRKLLRAAFAVWKTGESFDIDRFIAKR